MKKDIFIHDDRWVDYKDDQGRLVTMPLRRAMRLTQRRAAKADQALGIERKHIPVQHFETPDHPDTRKFIQLASAIEQVAHQIPVQFETAEARVWMRCQQLYWHAKGIALAQRICPLPMPDPLADGEFIQKHLLPSAALRNLRLDVDADESWYHLVTAGEPYVRQWAEEQGYDYPFATAEEFFLETLQIGFETSLTEGILCPTPPHWDRKQYRNHFRRWLKFLRDRFEGEQEAEFEAILRTMSWKGYALLVLRPLKTQPSFKRLWQRYLKAQVPLESFQATAIYWEDGWAYQSDTAASERRTRRRMRIASEVTNDGHFIFRRYDESP